MTDQTTDNGTGRALAAPAEQRQIHRVENLQPMLDSDRFEHFQRAASALMHSTILNPSIRGDTPAQCFSNLMLVFDLSDRWKLPALSIAQCIAIVHNKVVYEGKLITAMLKASLGFTLDFHYTGERGAKDYRVYVSDRPFEEMSEEQLASLAPDSYPRGWRIIDGTVGDWQTFQKDGRTVNPAWTGAASKNQLAYRGSREWCRLYEPAQLLGVYGDDEIDTMQIRMDRARDVTPAPAAISSGLSAGFARNEPAPAETTVTAEIAEIELPGDETIDANTGEVLENGPAEAQDGQERSEAAKPAADAKVSPAKPKAAAKAPAKADAVKATRKAELETAQGWEKAAHGAAIFGSAESLEDFLKSCFQKPTEEGLGFARNGWAKGAQVRLAELEEAYQMGLAGTPMIAPDWLTTDVFGPKRWDALRAEWARGAADFETQKVEGDDESDFEGESGEEGALDPDSALGAIADAEPELVDQVLQDHADDDSGAFDDAPVDPIDAFRNGLPNLTSWEGIKRSLNALGKSDAWADAAKNNPARIAEARRWAWEREAALIADGAERFDFLNDLTAFRCWIETTTDADAIEGNWMTLVRQPIYQNLGADQKAGLERATMARMAAIKGGQG